jgi:hypothetical protein
MTTSAPALALSSVLSSAEAAAVFHALADRYVSLRDRRDRMLGYYARGDGMPDGGSWADAADRDTERLTAIESVVSKLPEFLRVEWAREVERVAS